MPDNDNVPVGSGDRVLPFSVEALDARGRSVFLSSSFHQIVTAHDYPAPVSALLGEALALACLLASTSVKHSGRFQLQTRTDGIVSMLVVDVDDGGKMRGYARFDAERLQSEVIDAASLLGKGHMAFTIEPEHSQQRYQGIVPLEAGSLEKAADDYFEQSEQIRTCVKLRAVGPDETLNALSHWVAGGIMLQQLPQASPLMAANASEEELEAARLAFERELNDHWDETVARVDTVETDELTDQDIGLERVLYRLFHPHEVRVFDNLPFSASCRCSEERIREMLQGFESDAVHDMADETGMISITCEFCSTQYNIAHQSL
jgi:molecular chaperone Hsp33